MDAYTEMGGVTGALARHASGVLDDIAARALSRFRSVDGAAEKVGDYARRLLLRLVDVGASEQDDRRRRMPVSDMPSIDDQGLGGDLALDASRLVREALEEGRLVVSVRLAGGIEALELAHD